jgi:4-amino-4-deoxy-L-arabinose transferase-like glycosyltransferase
MFACMDASLKSVCSASLGITYTAYYILGREQILFTLRFQTHTVQIQPPFNIPPLPNWLTV